MYRQRALCPRGRLVYRFHTRQFDVTSASLSDYADKGCRVKIALFASFVHDNFCNHCFSFSRYVYPKKLNKSCVKISFKNPGGFSKLCSEFGLVGYTYTCAMYRIITSRVTGFFERSNCDVKSKLSV